MRFYGIVQAFRRGRMPDNHQIDHTFNYILSHPPIDVNKLSPEGRKLVDDVRELLEVVSRPFPPPASALCLSPLAFPVPPPSPRQKRRRGSPKIHLAHLG
jgi:hypothetical protein